MRIDQVNIENFRSIKSINQKLPPVCALVGPNNCGKSNILQAIQKVVGREYVSVNNFDEDDVRHRDGDKDIQIEVSFQPPIEYRKYKHGDATLVKTLSFRYTKYKIGEEKGSRRLEQQCLDESGNPPIVLARAPRKNTPPSFERIANIPPEVKERIPLIFIGSNRSFKDHLPDAKYSLLRQLLADINCHADLFMIPISEKMG